MPQTYVRSTVLLTLIALLGASAPAVADDPVSDAQRWAGCADWIVEETLETVQPYRDVLHPVEKIVKCKLRLRATPIVIDDDNDLFLVNAAGVKVPNAANGVSGSGTWEDPWTIGGFEFDGRVVGCTAISISNIETILHISDNWIHDSTCGEGAVRVTNSRYFKVHDNTISASTRGIVVRDALMFSVHQNRIEAGYGVRDPTTGLTLAVGQRSADIAISVTSSEYATVDENVIVRGSSNLATAQHAISLSGVKHYGIRYNTIEDTTGASIVVASSGGYSGIRGNSIHRPPTAILVFWCDAAERLEVRANWIYSPQQEPIIVHDGCAVVWGENYIR